MHARARRLTPHAAAGIRENALRESIEVYLKDISEAMAKREARERDAAAGSCQPSGSRSAVAADKTTGSQGGEGQDDDMEEEDAEGKGADIENGPGVGSYSKSGKFLVDMRTSHDHISTHAAKLLDEQSAEAGQARVYRRFSQEVFSTASDEELEATREVQTPLALKHGLAPELLSCCSCCPWTHVVARERVRVQGGLRADAHADAASWLT